MPHHEVRPPKRVPISYYWTCFQHGHHLWDIQQDYASTKKYFQWQPILNWRIKQSIHIATRAGATRWQNGAAE
eukprot:4556598-Lingulodinium_polyedra.AAC.1